MKAVIVARDAAPTDAGKILAEELARKGHEAVSFLGGGEPIAASADEIAAAIRQADVLWLGMSAPESNAVEELAAEEVAKEAGVPYGLYSDMKGAWDRPWFRKAREGASILFVTNEKEKEAAVKVYQGEVVASGNPVWEMFKNPTLSREAVRDKLGVAFDEVMVLCVGHKVVPFTGLLWMSVVQALHEVSLVSRKYRVFLSPHPGEITLQSGLALEKIYGELKQYSGGIPVDFLTKSILSTSELSPYQGPIY